MTRYQNSHAVSPVVGVMLMLVVTIIIAAVVSAFAGGMSGGTKQVPQATIKAFYSQADGMRLEHNGGDVLSTSDIKILVRDTENMASGLGEVSEVVNKSIIQNTPTDPTKFWVNYTYGGKEVTRWAPGETMYITAANCKGPILQPNIYNYGAAYHSNASWATISDPSQVGSTFILEIYTNDGRQILQQEVPITG